MNKPQLKAEIERVAKRYNLPPEVNTAALATEILSKVDEYVGGIIPEKKINVPYKHRGFADLTETSLNEASENVKINGYNQAISEMRERGGV